MSGGRYTINPYTQKIDQIVGPGDLTQIKTYTRPLYISNTQPATSETKYLWIQTGLGTSNTDVTFWVEDGQ